MELKSFKENIWIYTKYFIIIKLCLFFILIPVFYRSVLFLISSTGQKALTSGNFKQVMMTPQGLALILISFIFFTLYISMDINTSIFISASLYKGRKKIRLRTVLKDAIKFARVFFSPVGVFFVVYAVLLVPLAGVGLGTSISKGFKIPNFVTSAIYDNKLHFILYIIALLVLTVMSFSMVFTFHYILLRKETIRNAVRKSRSLVRRHIKDLLVHLIVLTVGLIFMIMLVVILGQLALSLIEMCAGTGNYLSRFLMIFILLASLECLQLLTFFFVPIEIHSLTSKFYEYEGEPSGDEPAAAVDSGQKTKRGKKTALVIASILIFNAAAGGVCAFLFDELFYNKTDALIVAHRGGGNLGPENTITGMEAAVQSGAGWSEIDVQRAKDGKYIINHDETFARLAGDDRAVTDMTWDQIKRLTVKDSSGNFPKGAAVPSLEETMDFAKGHMGLFIELKGKTADRKMADDVASAIREKRMEEEAVVISLDYEIIEYVEKTYPDIKTGYLYFFAVGDVSRFDADYLIMEEDLVNKDVVDRLHKAKKNVMAWTVNKEEAVTPLVNAGVDGIITDNIKGIRNALKEEKEKTDIDIITEKIMGILK